MSGNQIINALIAYIAGRTTEARNALRTDPTIPAHAIGPSMARLQEAIELRQARAVDAVLRKVLSASGALTPAEHDSSLEQEAYFRGVTDLESILEDVLHNLPDYL